MDFAGASLRLSSEGEKDLLATLDQIQKKAQQTADDYGRLTTSEVRRAADAFDALYKKQEIGTKQINDEIAAIQRLAKSIDVTDRTAVAGFRENAAAQQEWLRSVQATEAQHLRLESTIRQVEAAVERETSAAVRGAEASAMRYGRGLESIARGGEMVARTGMLTGRSLDAVMNAGAMMAFSFGAAGPIVGAIGIATASMVELFNRARKEAEDTKNKFITDLEAIARAGDAVKAGQKQQALYSGDPFALRHEGESSLDFVARSRGITGLAQLQNTLQSQLAAAEHKAGRGGFVGSGDVTNLADQLNAVTAKLKEMNGEYAQVSRIADQVYQREGERAGVGLELARQKAQEKEDAKDLLKTERERAKLAKEHYTYKEPTVDGIAKALAGAYDNARKAGEPTREGLGVLDPTKGVAASVVSGIRAASKAASEEIDKFKKDQEEQIKQVRESYARGLTSAITGGVDAMVNALVSSGGNIGKGFEALATAAIAGLGRMVQQWGEKALEAAILAKLTAESLFDPTGAGIVAALSMIALGAAMQGAAGHATGSGSRGSVSTGSSYTLPPSVVNAGTARPTQTVANPGQISARPTVNNYNTIIGPDDPRAQRLWQELQKKSMARGEV